MPYCWAVGGLNGKTRPGNNRPEAGLLGIRGRWVVANASCRIFEPLRKRLPLRAEIIGEAMDIMVVRELTGGIYFGERGRKEKRRSSAAYDTEMYTVTEVERIVRVAFRMAMKRGKKLCAVDKANGWNPPVCGEKPSSRWPRNIRR